MAEAQPVNEDGLPSNYRTARLNIVNMSEDMARFGPDTPKLIQAIRDTTDEDMIELDGLSLKSLPDFGKDLGYHTLILKDIQGVPEITQTHLRDLLVSNADMVLKTLNVGNVDFLSVIQDDFDNHFKLKLNIVGPIRKKIELDNMLLKDSRSLTLTVPSINLVYVNGVEELTVGPGCTILNVSYMDVKRIIIQDPDAIQYAKFHDMRKLEFHTPLAASTLRSGDYFSAPVSVSSANEDLIRAVKQGNLEGVRAALAAGANANAREGDIYQNTAIGLATTSDTNIEIVRELLAAGADPSYTNIGGVTAWEMAEEFGAVEIASLLRPRSLPSFTDEPAAPPPKPTLPTVVLTKVEVPYANQQVFDFEEGEDVPILQLLSKMGNIVFKAKDSYFTLPADRLYDAMDDESQVRYKCNAKLDGAPFVDQVDMMNPYYYIQGNGNFIVSLAQLNSGLHEYKILELVETEETLEYVASANSVQTTPGVNRLGNDVNIVSADHCQAGTQQKVFKLHGVILIHEAPNPAPASGEKRKRTDVDSDVSRVASIIRGMSAGRTTRKRNNRTGRKTIKNKK